MLTAPLLGLLGVVCLSQLVLQLLTPVGAVYPHSLLVLYGAGEQDNKVVPASMLYGSSPYRTGIAIDVDAVAPPPGVYTWVRISSPLSRDNDPAEIDAIEILP